MLCFWLREGNDDPHRMDYQRCCHLLTILYPLRPEGIRSYFSDNGLLECWNAGLPVCWNGLVVQVKGRCGCRSIFAPLQGLHAQCPGRGSISQGKRRSLRVGVELTWRSRGKHREWRWRSPHRRGSDCCSPELISAPGLGPGHNEEAIGFSLRCPQLAGQCFEVVKCLGCRGQPGSPVGPIVFSHGLTQFPHH